MPVPADTNAPFVVGVILPAPPLEPLDAKVPLAAEPVPDVAATLFPAPLDATFSLGPEGLGDENAN
jgi:hypothetical protein